MYLGCDCTPRPTISVRSCNTWTGWLAVFSSLKIHNSTDSQALLPSLTAIDRFLWFSTCFQGWLLLWSFHHSIPRLPDFVVVVITEFSPNFRPETTILVTIGDLATPNITQVNSGWLEGGYLPTLILKERRSEEAKQEVSLRNHFDWNWPKFRLESVLKATIGDLAHIASTIAISSRLEGGYLPTWLCKGRKEEQELLSKRDKYKR